MQRKKLILLYGWLFGLILKEQKDSRNSSANVVSMRLLLELFIYSYSKRCSETCFIGVDKRLRFKESFSFGCFCLVAINMHFVLARSSAIKFVQHQSELRLCCKSLRIMSMLSLAVLCVSQSANTSHYTDLGERHRGKLLMKMPNRRGPGIDP